jgi:hypothetical protein
MPSHPEMTEQRKGAAVACAGKSQEEKGGRVQAKKKEKPERERKRVARFRASYSFIVGCSPWSSMYCQDARGCRLAMNGGSPRLPRRCRVTMPTPKNIMIHVREPVRRISPLGDLRTHIGPAAATPPPQNPRFLV